MNRRLLAVAAASLALLAACSEPAKGHCTGTLNGKPFDADIDPESEHRTVQRQVCTESSNKTRWLVSYGEGALQIAALSPAASNTSLSGKELALPPPFETSFFEEWSVLAPTNTLLAPGGTVSLPANIDLSDNLFGTFRMSLQDGSELECTFSLPQGHDEGYDIDCPDEHHSDDDDWD